MIRHLVDNEVEYLSATSHDRDGTREEFDECFLYLSLV